MKVGNSDSIKKKKERKRKMKRRKKVREKGDNKKERKALGSDTERVVGKNHRE